MSDPGRWLAEPDEDSRPYFDAMPEGKLRLQRCGDGSPWFFPFLRRCQNCGSTNLEWAEASGRGTIFSHARLRREYHPRHAERLPLVIAWIDLEEGVRMASNVVGTEPDDIAVGQTVEVDFERFPDEAPAHGDPVPVFRIHKT